MRVCFVTSQSEGTAGWGRYTVELIRGLLPLGIEPVLALPKNAVIDPALTDCEVHRVLPPLLKYRFSTPRSLRHAPTVRRVMQTCDLSHCTVELHLPLASLAAKHPLIANAHGTWAIRPLENASQRFFFAPAFHKATTILCLSQYTQKRLLDLIPLNNTIVATGGVWIQDYQQMVQLSLPEWQVGHNIMFTAAAMKPRKGQRTTLKAFAKAQQQIPNLRWVLSGPMDRDSAYVQGFWQDVAARGLQDVVHHLGLISQEELVKWYQRADIFVVNAVNDGSSFEGLGLVYLEAGAAKTPSIGSLNCGAEDAIIDGQTGYLVPQLDVEATAQALIRFFNNTEREQMRQAAFDHAQSLSWDNLAKQVLAVYQSALA